MSLTELSSSLPPQRRDWSDRIKQPPLTKTETTPLDSEQKRGRAILEILETEQSYQRLLGDFIGFFLRDLESGEHEQARAFMSLPNLAALCSNMEQIFHLSHQFCAELKAAYESETTVPGDDAKCTRRWARIAIGPIFCRFSSLLALYEQYVENHGFGKLDIARFTSNKQFQQFWQKCGEELKQSLDTSAYRNRRGSVDSIAFRRHSMKPQYEKSSHSIAVSSGDDLKQASVNSQPRAPPQQQRVGTVVSLEGYLILPIQRIPRYALLLKEIEKLTVKICSNAKQIRIQGMDRFYERELDDLARAYELVSNAAASMNEAMRRSEANIDMLQLQAQFTNKVDLVQCDEGRMLVREGALRVLHAPPNAVNVKKHKDDRDLTFHLFSDRILCSEPSNSHHHHEDKFRCLYNLPLAQLSVNAREDEPTVFHLHEHLENGLVFSLQCTSAAERDDWVEEFQQCIAVSSQCELPIESDRCPLCLNKKFLSMWCQRCGLACCQDCLQRKRLLPAGEEAQLCCDLCRLEIDMTANDDEPTKFRLVVNVHASRAHKTCSASAADFFSLTPRDGGRRRAQQSRRIRGPSTLGHAACFSIPIGPAFDVDEEESSRFWVLHAFSGTREVGHLTLDVEQIVCNSTMFTELKLDQERFQLAGGDQRRSVTISFELLFPPALWTVLPTAVPHEDDDNSRQQSTFSMLLTVPGTSLALPVEKRAYRFAEQEQCESLNLALLVQYEKMAKERPARFSILCVKYLYLEVARMYADNRQVMETVQERDVRFDRALEKSYAGIARDHGSAVRYLSSHLSTRAIEHFDRAGGATVAADTLMSKRDFVLNDLISTEQTYVSSLKLLNEVFVTPLIHLSHGASVSTVVQMIKTQRGAGTWLPSSQSVQNLGACPLQAEVIVLLQCVRQILSVNHHLLTELQFRRKASAVALVGDIFKRFSVVLKVYIAYLTNHAEVERLFIDGAAEDSSLPQFVRFLQEDVRCSEGGDTFIKLLRLPKERLTRYKRFLYGLLMHTPEEHADAQPIRDSLLLLEESEQHISWSVRRKSNMEKLVEIQRSFIKVLPLQQKVPQLVSSRRWFVKEGDLVKRCRWDDRQFHFWLFNDALVYGDRMVGGQYRFCRMLDLRGITVQDLEQGADSRPQSVGDYRFAFEIRSATKSFICMVPHSVESAGNTPKSITGSLTDEMGKPTGEVQDVKLWMKQEWMREITQCVNSLAAEEEEIDGQESEGEEKQQQQPREQSTTAPVVMQYESVTACMNCNSRFSLTLRRHHCRRCAAVVCHFCSKARLVLGNMSADKKQRVCVNCVEEIQAAGRTSRAMARTGPMRRSSEIL